MHWCHMLIKGPKKTKAVKDESKRSPRSIGNGSLNIVNAAWAAASTASGLHFTGSFSRKFPIAERDYDLDDYRNKGLKGTIDSFFE